MIIKLPKLTEIVGDKQDFLVSIDNLLKSHGEGKHHLWMPIETVKFLSTMDGLCIFSKQVLIALMSQVVEEAGLFKEFSFYADVNFEDKHILNYREGVLRIGYGHFLDSTAIQESILLSENGLDGEAYLWGANVYLALAGIRGMRVNMEIQPGGGNTTYDQFERLEKSKRFFACIVDSDQDHPNAPLGETARRFNRVEKGFSKRRYFEVLNCHELENILPLKIVKELFEDICDTSLVQSNKYIKYRVYPDHKAGLCIKQARLDDAKYKANYWSIFEDLEEEALVCARFGNNMLKSCIDFMKQLSPKKAASYIDSNVDLEWIRISKMIASWGVGGRGLRS
ncbi:hypothetical protein [Pseudomonas aeruginosa]|uniref:hypothetical protein n=1 Tax=Pseudomonas aeruginosa TaxID=287 RepID=UPI001F4CFEE4|nr:hypothetical protein [Pseudomonas aeruginosa]UTQ25837.1 hypothetical protein MMZ72_24865 [Pseudomonas aeruginosa]